MNSIIIFLTTTTTTTTITTSIMIITPPLLMLSVSHSMFWTHFHDLRLWGFDDFDPCNLPYKLRAVPPLPMPSLGWWGGDCSEGSPVVTLLIFQEGP